MDTDKILESGKVVDDVDSDVTNADKSVLDVDAFVSADDDEGDVVFPKGSDVEDDTKDEGLVDIKKQVHAELKEAVKKNSKTCTNASCTCGTDCACGADCKCGTKSTKKVDDGDDDEVEIEEKVEKNDDTEEETNVTKKETGNFMEKTYEERSKILDDMREAMIPMYERLKDGVTAPTPEETKHFAKFTAMETAHWKLRMQDKIKDMNQEEKMKFLQDTNVRVNDLQKRLKSGEKLDRKTMTEEEKETMGFLKMTMDIQEKQANQYRLTIECVTPQGFVEGRLIQTILPQTRHTPALKNGGKHFVSVNPPKGTVPGSKFRCAFDFRELIGVPIPENYVAGNPVTVQIGNIPIRMQVPNGMKANDCYWIHKSMLLGSIKNMQKKNFQMKQKKEAEDVLKEDGNAIMQQEQEKKNVATSAPGPATTTKNTRQDKEEEEKALKTKDVKSANKKKNKKKLKKKVGSFKEDLLILSGVVGLGLAAYFAWATFRTPTRRRR